MPGLTTDTFDYLRDLAANNDRDWFEANRTRYETAWLDPARSVVRALAPMAEALNTPHRADPAVNKSIRRINRDTRFSKDKTPYAPQMHLIFWTGGHPNRSPGLHLVVHGDHVGYGAGQWAMDPDALARYRAAVAGPAAHDLLDAIAAANAVGCSLTEETLKRLPPGIAADHPAATLLRRKGLVVRTITGGLSPDDAIGAAGLDRMTEILQRLAPINAWLAEHVGA